MKNKFEMKIAIDSTKTDLQNKISVIQADVSSLVKYAASGDYGACGKIAYDLLHSVGSFIWIAAWLYSHRED